MFDDEGKGADPGAPGLEDMDCISTRPAPLQHADAYSSLLQVACRAVHHVEASGCRLLPFAAITVRETAMSIHRLLAHFGAIVVRIFYK